MHVAGVSGVVLASFLITGAVAHAATRAIDLEHSTLTVHVFKAGLFSAFADNHVIRAPIESAKVEDGEQAHVEVAVDARKLKVLDPDLAPKKRDEVQVRMLGPEVLDTARFQEIRFKSSKIQPLAEGRWRVEGTLELHGKSAPLSFEVTAEKGRCRGSATLRQKTFGIQPISIAGGTVKVKDEIRVDFDIATGSSEPSARVSGSGSAGARAR